MSMNYNQSISEKLIIKELGNIHKDLKELVEQGKATKSQSFSRYVGSLKDSSLEGPVRIQTQLGDCYYAYRKKYDDHYRYATTWQSHNEKPENIEALLDANEERNAPIPEEWSKHLEWLFSVYYA